MSSLNPNHFAVVADVGGTHIRFAALSSQNAPLQHIEIFACALFSQVDDAISAYLKRLSTANLPDGKLALLCLALPGAVHTDTVRLTNLAWQINSQELAAKFDCQVVLVNDFTAQAKAIPSFSDSDLEWLRPQFDGGDHLATSTKNLARAIIGPGTGLGVAGLLPSGEVVESEAGHISFSPGSPGQQQLLTALWQLFPRVSVERLLSGPGLANIHRGLLLLAKKDGRLTPEEITAGALNGDPLCRQAISEFNRILGSVCGDLALAFGAVGGVFLSGGMLTNLGSLFDRAEFLHHFGDKGRFTAYCNKIPVALVLSSQPGLIGAANCIRHLFDAGSQIAND